MASSKKDMRRADLVVPYVEAESEQEETSMTSTIAGTMPMAAIFTRNKIIGWVAVAFALQAWLAETPEQKKRSSTPGYFSVLMAFMSLAVGYVPLFLPPVSQGIPTATEAEGPVPPT